MTGCLGLLPLAADDGCGLMVACMAPARGHNDIEAFIDQPRRLNDILSERQKFPEISLYEGGRGVVAGDAVFGGDILFFRAVGSKDAIPYGQQVAEIRIHVQRVPRVMHAVMGRCEDIVVEEAEPAVADHILAYMDKSSPG